MASSYTPLLGLVLPTQGELQGTWGDTVNDELTSLVDSAVAGTTTLSTDADVTLTETAGGANEARQAIILWTATGSSTRYITAPARSKTYVVINASGGTQSIVIRGVGPTTGVTVIKGEKAVIAWNGSDFVKVSNQEGSAVFSSILAAPSTPTILDGQRLNLVTTSATGTIAAFTKYVSASLGPVIQIQKARGTPTAPANNNTNDTIGAIIWSSYSSSLGTFQAVAQFTSQITSAGSASFNISTLNDAASLASRFFIGRSGGITVGSNSLDGAEVTTSSAAKFYVGSAIFNNNSTAVSGTVAHVPVVAFASTSYSATNASVTYTNASTLYLDGAPTASTNITITNPWSLYINSGAVYFGDNIAVNKTVTPGGTTGAQTINKTAGTVNFAAAASSLIVTNSLVTSDSVIIATVATNDLTLKSVQVVAGSGSFTLYANAAATAETRVNFLVIN